MLKSRVPKIDPCDVPVIMSYQELKEEPILFLFYDYFSSQKMTKSLMENLNFCAVFRQSKRIFKLNLSRLYASNLKVSHGAHYNRLLKRPLG